MVAVWSSISAEDLSGARSCSTFCARAAHRFYVRFLVGYAPIALDFKLNVP
jgi:hypothetical protein